MRRKHYRAEEIITKLREAEVLIAQISSRPNTPETFADNVIYRHNIDATESRKRELPFTP